jgi:hypothetical protein
MGGSDVLSLPKGWGEEKDDGQGDWNGEELEGEQEESGG